MMIGIGVSVAGLFFALAFLFVRSRRNPPEAPKPPRCSDCAHFDLAAGQTMLNSNPAFVQVMRAISPNQEFGTKTFREEDRTDAEGNVTKHRVAVIQPVYPPFEDRWEYLGACTAEGHLRHRTDSCPKFQRRVGQ